MSKRGRDRPVPGARWPRSISQLAANGGAGRAGCGGRRHRRRGARHAVRGAAACARLCARRAGQAAQARLHLRRRRAAAARGERSLIRSGPIRSSMSCRRCREGEHERSSAGIDAQGSDRVRAQERRLEHRDHCVPGRGGDGGASDARDGTIYAALKHGHFGPSCIAPTTADATSRKSARRRFRPMPPARPRVFQYWTLETGGPQHPDRLWMGCIPAGPVPLRGSRRDLATGRLAVERAGARDKWFGGGYDDAGIHSVSPDPRDPDRTVIAISCGGVWDTRDDGKSWTVRGKGLIAGYMPPDQQETPEIQDPHRLVRCPSAPDTHVGAASLRHLPLGRRRRDAGRRSSRRATISALPSPCIRTTRRPRGSCRRSRTSCACRATARCTCIARSDGGATWQALRDGLPQHDAFDLVYRHGLDVDDSGARLAMGSTTGALWVERRWRRRLAAGQCASAADLCGAVRIELSILGLS